MVMKDDKNFLSCLFGLEFSFDLVYFFEGGDSLSLLIDTNLFIETLTEFGLTFTTLESVEDITLGILEERKEGRGRERERGREGKEE